MQKLFSTSDAPAGERASYWHDALRGAFVQLDCTFCGADEQVFGQIETARLATVELSRIAATAQNVRRTRRGIATASADRFFLNLQLEGQGVLLQDGRELEMKPGGLTLFDTMRPYELIFRERFEGFVVSVPGEWLRRRIRDRDMLTAREIASGTGAGRLLRTMLTMLASDAGTIEEEAVPSVAASLEDMLVAGLLASGDNRRGRRDDVAARRGDRIRAFAAEHLCDPGLSVDTIASSFGVAASTIHRSFSDQACSLNVWIWNERINRARADLGDPAMRGRTITEIAFAWGFNDSGHFSRAFRRRFGCRPRDIRSALH